MNLFVVVLKRELQRFESFKSQEQHRFKGCVNIFQEPPELTLRDLSAMVAGEDPSPHPKLDAFGRLVAASSERKLSPNQQKFVKKLDNIPSVDLPTEHPCRTAMNIADQCLIGQFTSI